MQKKKFNLSGTLAFAIAVLVLAVFVPINLIANYYDKVYDMTPSGKYTLSDKTAKLLDETSDEQIEVFFLSDLKYLQEVPQALPLYHTLTELDSRDNITLTCFDPNENTTLAEELNPSGVLTVGTADVFVRANGITKQIIFDKIFQTDSNGILEYAGEELIAGAIKICTDGSLPKVYFLTGYGENTVEDAYSGYAEAIESDNYDVQSLDLSSVDAVPSDTAIVYLAGADRDISAADREKLSQYIDNGGAVSMLLPPSATEGRFTNIEYLLAKFELSMDYNQISESNASYQYRDQDNQQSADYFKVTYPTPSEDFSEDLTTDINVVLASDSSIAGISHPRSFTELTSSSELIEKSIIIENLPVSQDSYEYTIVSTPMGGDEETAEAAEALTNTAVGMGWYSYNKQTGAKLILIGSDEMITNEGVSPNTTGTRVLTLFSNTWLCDSDMSMGIGNKSNSYDTMHFEDAEEATSTLRIFIIVPVIIALCGVAVWLKRRYA